MNRRRFFQRIAKASLAFAVAPGVFKALPATQGVREVVVRPSLEFQEDFVESFFFGKPITRSTTVEFWQDLEPIQAAEHPCFTRLSQLAHAEEKLS